MTCKHGLGERCIYCAEERAGPPPLRPKRTYPDSYNEQKQAKWLTEMDVWYRRTQEPV